MKQDSHLNYRTKALQGGGQRTGLLEMISARLVWTSRPHCWCKTFGRWARVHQETHGRGELHTAGERCLCQSPGKQLHRAPFTPEPGSWDASFLYWNLVQRWKEWIHRSPTFPASTEGGGKGLSLGLDLLTSHNHTYTIEPFWGQTSTGWVRISAT